MPPIENDWLTPRALAAIGAPIEPADGPAVIAGASSQLDLNVARGVFGDDTALFVSLLAGLLREFSDFTLPPSPGEDDVAARTALLARLHKLGGGAALIGATTVHRVAGAAEAALASGEASEMVEGLLRRLGVALTALSEEAAPMLVQYTSRS